MGEKNTTPILGETAEVEREVENDTIVALLSLYIELGRMQELASNSKLSWKFRLQGGNFF